MNINLINFDDVKVLLIEFKWILFLQAPIHDKSMHCRHAYHEMCCYILNGSPLRNWYGFYVHLRLLIKNKDTCPAPKEMAREKFLRSTYGLVGICTIDFP